MAEVVACFFVFGLQHFVEWEGNSFLTCSLMDLSF